MKKLLENKALKIIGNILYYLLVILVVMILAVVLLQRVTNNNISLAGIRVFNIVTESMVPKYQVGDILISKTIEPDKIKEGDDLGLSNVAATVCDFLGLEPNEHWNPSLKK